MLWLSTEYSNTLIHYTTSYLQYLSHRKHVSVCFDSHESALLAVINTTMNDLSYMISIDCKEEPKLSLQLFNYSKWEGHY